jgi:hypothetical protein
MAILNADLLHKSCGGKMTHKKFRKILVRFDCTIAQGEHHGKWSFLQEAKFIWGPTEPTRGKTFAMLAIQRETKTCAFSEQENQEHPPSIVKCVMLVCVSWTALKNGIQARASECEH